jgi:hypothetical protein
MIEGKVAQILSERCVILNVGTAHGVKPGTVFIVLARGEEVRDPDSGAVLGRWELPKGMVRVTHAQERLATCEAYRPSEEADTSGNVLSAAMITHSMRPDSWGGGPGRGLKVNRGQVTGMPQVGPVSVGDPVREFGEDAGAGVVPVEPASRPGAPEP